MAHNTKYLGRTRDAFERLDSAPQNTRPLGVRVVENAAVGYWKPQIRFAHQPIKHVKIWTGGHRAQRYVDKDVVLLGFAEMFFGHFLADSLSRAWVALDPKYRNAEFVVVAEKDVPAFGRELYTLLGIKNLTVVTERTRFRSVTIPDSSFDYPTRFYDKKFADTAAAIARAVPVDKASPKKIYFSRLALAENPTLGEQELQKIFEDNGYAVVSAVQVLPVRDQIALARGATHIAGLGGTALHHSLFAADGIHLVAVHRYNALMPMQVFIDTLKKIDAIYIDGSMDPFSKKKNDCPVTLVGLNDAMRAFLDDHGFKYDASTAADTRNMNIFLHIWKHCHRRLPRWIARLIVLIVPFRAGRKAMRRRLGLSFQGMTRAEIIEMFDPNKK
jgi:capsular polysaccharide biosynthesis protein